MRARILKGKNLVDPREDEVRDAELRLNRSASEFESAMGHLGNKVDGTRRRVEEIRGRVNEIKEMPRRKWGETKDQVRSATEHAKASARQTGDRVRESSVRFKNSSAPAPVSMAAGILIASGVGAVFGARWGLFRRAFRRF